MAYIGKQPTVGNFVKLDAITTSATTTFNLTNGGVAYFPQSPNHCLVSLNGILQAPTDSFTISGSTIIFSNALTTSDVIDFIIVLGDVLNIGTPSDNTVTAAKIVNGTITANKFASGVGGKVLQVVQSTTATSSETSSTSFVTTGLTASITPSSTSNKILAISSFGGGNNNGVSGAGLEHIYTLYRGSTDLGAASSKGFNPVTYYTATGNAPILYSIPVSITYLDSPSTTSSTTYGIYFRVNNASYGAQFCRYNSTATLILMEIAG